MVSRATVINTDPGYGRVMDPDMALGHNPGRADTMNPVDSIAHPNLAGFGSGTALGNTNMITACGPDSGYPCGPWKKHGPETSTQTLAVTGHRPRPQQQPRLSPWPPVVMQAIQIDYELLLIYPIYVISIKVVILSDIELRSHGLHWYIKDACALCLLLNSILIAPYGSMKASQQRGLPVSRTLISLCLVTDVCYVLAMDFNHVLKYALCLVSLSPVMFRLFFCV
ncbi:hypothetical protein STEG23_032024 [Scotinomys teguina]